MDTFITFLNPFRRFISFACSSAQLSGSINHGRHPSRLSAELLGRSMKVEDERASLRDGLRDGTVLSVPRLAASPVFPSSLVRCPSVNVPAEDEVTDESEVSGYFLAVCVQLKVFSSAVISSEDVFSLHHSVIKDQ